MARFFVKTDSIVYDETDNPLSVEITGSDVRHIKDVLRMNIGDTFFACDSIGNEFLCRISRITSDKVEADIENAARNCCEPRIIVILCQGVAKGDKMDFIIQKTVELGINKIVPVMTEHTVVRYENHKDAEKKQIRWQRIAEEASKQCGRGVVPEVLVPTGLREALLDCIDESTLLIMPYENETETTLKQVLKENENKLADGGQIKKIAVFIGPEGGISSKEAEFAKQLGFRAVTLGKRILRTETAGLSVVAAIRYEIGD